MSRKPYSGGGNPAWPKFFIRNIPPALWEAVKARARAESADGQPRINAICVRLLQLYATHGLPAGQTPPHMIGSEPHTVGTDPPTVENDPIGRFRPPDTDEAL